MNALGTSVERHSILGRRRHRANKRELPWPLVRLSRHPVRFAFNAVNGLGNKAVWTYIGTLIAATIYWVATQTNVPIHDGWHRLVPDDVQRHLYRAALEAIAAGFAVRLIGFNYYKAVKHEEMGRIKRFLVKRLQIPQPGDDETLTLGQALWADRHPGAGHQPESPGHLRLRPAGGPDVLGPHVVHDQPGPQQLAAQGDCLLGRPRRRMGDQGHRR
jgi:hypothetical protein